jgi:hypothetical protein
MILYGKDERASEHCQTSDHDNRQERQKSENL